jgi:V8-like Glu-specific endopeptidase
MRIIAISSILCLLGGDAAFGQGIPARAKEYLDKLPATTAVQGAFHRQAGGSVVFVPDDQRQIALPVTNQDEVAKTALGLPIRADIRKAAGGVEIKGVTLSVVAEWSKLKAELHPQRYQEVHGALDSLAQATDRAFQTGALALPPELAPGLQLSEEQIIKAYLSLPAASHTDRVRLVGLFEKLMRSQKAIYGRLDVYRPLAYRRIHETSQSAIALVERTSGERKCSGILVGTNLVLTARHCISGYFPAQELEVWINYEMDLDDRPLTREQFPIAGVEVEGQQVNVEGGGYLDFALLRLSANDAGKHAGDTHKWQCLSPGRMRRDDPLYIVGHAQGNPRTVHDNAWVLFPFAATELEYGRMLLLVEAEFKAADDREQWVRKFKDSYQERTEGTGKVYRQYSLRSGLNLQPTIAVEADTFHGNSGSAAFSRSSHLVVGVLSGGEPDLPAPWVPGWRRHEAIVPASEILEQVRSAKPQLLTEGQLCAK